MAKTRAESLAYKNTFEVDDINVLKWERDEEDFSKKVRIRYLDINGTPIVVWSQKVEEGGGFIMNGHAFALNSSGSQFYSADFKCSFRRQTGGNVLIAGNSDIVNRHTNLPPGNFGIKFSVDTTDQLAELVIDPANSIRLNWVVEFKILN